MGRDFFKVKGPTQVIKNKFSVLHMTQMPTKNIFTVKQVLQKSELKVGSDPV